jgi:hypothetical protein
MKSSKGLFAAAVVLSITASTVDAASVDMKDPRRALGREDDVRIDAQVAQDTVSPGSPINVTYQVHNLSTTPVAVAHRTVDLSYDSETGLITLSVGAEVPADGEMPQLSLIGPNEKKTFATGANFNVAVPSVRSPFMIVPRAVRVKVNVLRNVEPFRELIRPHAPGLPPVVLTDSQFDAWLESNDAIFLNDIPVRFSPKGRRGTSAEFSAAEASPAATRGTW